MLLIYTLKCFFKELGFYLSCTLDNLIRHSIKKDTFSGLKLKFTYNLAVSAVLSAAWHHLEEMNPAIQSG